MYKLLRVNMSNLTANFEDIPEAYAGMGGRGLTSSVVAKEVDPTCNALGPLNKLVIACGLLAATNAANSGRASVGAKSPLTGTIKEANSGGQPGQYLGRLGIQGIIVEGLPEAGKLYKLYVGKDKVELSAADELKGLGNYDTVDKLKGEFGDKAGYITIGPAGEFMLGAASVAFTDPELRPTRHAGRGGLGAVMGSKGLKAIIVDPADTERAPLADPEAFKQAAKAFAKALSEHPVTGEGLPTYGTDVLINVMNEAGGLPTRNFSVGRFEGAEAVSGETLNQVTKDRGGVVSHGCMSGCVIRCSGIYNDADGNYLTKWPEYETVWAWGPNCGVNDLDGIAKIDRMCDDIGVDTIEVGCAVAVAMEGGALEFGDVAGATKLLSEIGQGTAMGRILGSGTLTTGKTFGVARIPTVKGQSLPAYDPRAVKGIGVTYATSTMGADHTAGYSVATNILGIGGSVDPLKAEGQVELSRNLQAATAAVDTAGLCVFVAFAMLDKPEAFQAVVDMLNAKYGLSLTGDDVGALGAKVLGIEKDFNVRAGFNKADDRLPDFFTYETLEPHGVKWDIPDEELDTTLEF